MTEATTPELFISYPAENAVAAREIRGLIEAGGHTCWMAPDDIRGTESWPEQIHDAIRSCVAVVLVMSAHTNESSHVPREVDLAIEEAKVLVPVRVEDVEPTGPLAYLLRLTHWIDAFPGPMVDHQHRIAQMIEAVVGPGRPREVSVVISCPKRDAKVARAAVEVLEDASMKCWYAPRDLGRDATDWAEAIDAAIDTSDAMVVVLSQRTGQSPQIAREVSRAIEGGNALFTVRTYEPTTAEAVGLEDPSTGTVSRTWWTTTLAAPGVDVRRQNLKEALGGLVPLMSDDHRDSDRADEPAFDLFISYRRGEGAELARLMQLKLKERDITAFLDVDALRPGHFDEALLTQIEDAPAFLLVLSEGALDRCSSQDDWLRREITHALATNRIIVPLITPRFEFPPEAELPEEIRPILVHHGVTYAHEFLEAVLDKIVSYLE